MCAFSYMRGHFLSCDKYGSQTMQSNITENPMIHANLTALSFTELEIQTSEV